ncbi:MAG: UMP kinase [Clostridiales bacterium]|jgi:uridylate kinase|nr:UMP kinase [Clostridiales bacterium]
MYKRALIKLSGEALACANGNGIDFDKVGKVVEQIKKVVESGVQVGIVIGGGNFWRGRQGRDMNRSTADYMGMLATAINSLGMQDSLIHAGIKAKLLTALGITSVGEPFNQQNAVKYLEEGYVVIFACGTGNPYFSTDTGAALRAAEIGADVLLLAKNVDGIYDSDPKINKNAKKYDKISYIDFIKQGLTAMDTSAVTLCMENNIPVIAFGLSEKESIVRVVAGEKMGTIIG